MFKRVKTGFVEKEHEVLKFWEDKEIFQKSLDQGRGKKPYTFFDGPPFATGLPHYGHLLAGVIKDAVTRYFAMNGYEVPRRFGWDCHGLPVENLVEKEIGIKGAAGIEEYGIKRFNDACRAVVLRYTTEWKRTVSRIGRWIDMDGGYKTMDPNFMESVWWVFSELYKKGLVYQGLKVMPISTKLGTVLSNFEANLNYMEIEDPEVVVKFSAGEGLFFLAWTTTPWTLPANLALTVNPEIDYVEIERGGERFILAKARLEAHFKEGSYKVLKEMKGSALVGMRYAPLFDCFKDHENAFQVLGDSFVTTEDGTGVVHTAPGHGEVDFFAAQKAGIKAISPIDMAGCYTAEVPFLKGIYVKDADPLVIEMLEKKGLIFSKGKNRHRYPFCWRSDTPLLYKTVTTWFIAVEKVKEALIKANSEVNWVPDHLKEGRFGKWLEAARDWAVSRNRYWGTPIPIWRAESGKILVIGSLDDLERYSGTRPLDLHRETIDPITFTYEGEEYSRVREVFDCWFESGSMPYAQMHYPFDGGELPIPGDFIAEGIDQTRGWFYTLMVISSALFGKPAFKNVIVNGIVLAEDGAKMSKRLQNYPDPEVVLEKYGADSVRLYLLSSPATYGEDLNFSEKGLELVTRQVLLPLWNSYYFLSTYAEIEGWKPTDLSLAGNTLIDRWVLSRLASLSLRVKEQLESYKLSGIVGEVALFLEEVTNWYIRRSRPRFWNEDDLVDQKAAFATLYKVIFDLIAILAPFAPFLTESIYQELCQEKDPLSLHLRSFPENLFPIDKELEEEMSQVMRLVTLGHRLRKEQSLKVRQPLSALHIDFGEQSNLVEKLRSYEDLIAEELNVKKICFGALDAVTLVLKPNFRALGKKFHSNVPMVVEAIKKLSHKEAAHFALEKSLTLTLEGEDYLLTEGDLTLEQKVPEGLVSLSEGGLVLILETALSEELILEGLSREVVSKINVMRKEASFELTDRIIIHFATASERVHQVVKLYRAHIMKETLAIELHMESELLEGAELDLSGEIAFVKLERV